jgi:hypothetical protein
VNRRIRDDWWSEQPGDDGKPFGWCFGLKPGEEAGPGRWWRLLIVELEAHGAIYDKRTAVPLDILHTDPGFEERTFAAMERTLAAELVAGTLRRRNPLLGCAA